MQNKDKQTQLFQRNQSILSIPAMPKTLDTMTDAELNKKLQLSYAQSLAGTGRPFDQVFDELERSVHY